MIALRTSTGAGAGRSSHQQLLIVHAELAPGAVRVLADRHESFASGGSLDSGVTDVRTGRRGGIPSGQHRGVVVRERPAGERRSESWIRVLQSGRAAQRAERSAEAAGKSGRQAPRLVRPQRDVFRVSLQYLQSGPYDRAGSAGRRTAGGGGFPFGGGGGAGLASFRCGGRRVAGERGDGFVGRSARFGFFVVTVFRIVYTARLRRRASFFT